jgi:hypothetical protein
MEMKAARTTALVLALSALSQCVAAAITIRMNAFPDQMVADGRSGTNITLEVRNTDGRIVPDGTRILLTTTLGTFRESIVSTQNGIARAILIAGNVAGTAKVTASEIGISTNPTVLEIDFVTSKDQLSTNNDFVEISTKGSLEYIYVGRIATASATKQGVSAAFQDIQLKAADLQYSYDYQVIRGRDVTATINKKEIYFTEFYFDLRKRKGYGLTQSNSILSTGLA